MHILYILWTVSYIFKELKKQTLEAHNRNDKCFSDGKTNLADLIIVYCTHVPNYYALPFKCAQLLGKIKILKYFWEIVYYA